MDRYDIGSYDDFLREQTKITQHGLCMMIRHGERADNVCDTKWDELGIEVENMKDPPLTPLGIQ